MWAIAVAAYSDAATKDANSTEASYRLSWLLDAACGAQYGRVPSWPACVHDQQRHDCRMFNPKPMAGLAAARDG